MNKPNLIALALLGAGAALVASPGQAAMKSWSFNSSSCTQSGSSYGNSFSCKDNYGVASATATAWANTDGYNSSNDGTPQKIQNAQLSLYPGGFGVKNRDATDGGDGSTSGSNDVDGSEGVSPEHSTDSDQRYDSVLLSFNEDIKLTSLTIGWSQTDSDITVLAYTLGGSPITNSDLSGLTYAQLLTNGWSLIGNYSDLVTGTPMSINAGGAFSSYWLVGAYNRLVGGGTWTANNDYVKLLAAAGNKRVPTPGPGVPEPATLGLLGIGLLAMRRFRSGRAA
jgi:PEP-CTERM motif